MYVSRSGEVGADQFDQLFGYLEITICQDIPLMVGWPFSFFIYAWPNGKMPIRMMTFIWCQLWLAMIGVGQGWAGFPYGIKGRHLDIRAKKLMIQDKSNIIYKLLHKFPTLFLFSCLLFSFYLFFNTLFTFHVTVSFLVLCFFTL